MEVRDLTAGDLASGLQRLWAASGEKLDLLAREYDWGGGAPVFTVRGKYTQRGWTEWTEGFAYGSSFLQFDASDEGRYADHARKMTVARMASHVSHTGVHDHGFNNVSTYGNWLRLIREGRLEDGGAAAMCELALKVSGAVQGSRWSRIHGGGGYIYSFNGPHSLFVDTVRSCRVLMLADALGHSLLTENDVRISLLQRALEHLDATAKYAVYYGKGRDSYDERGRTAHESVFNPNDGRYRCPNSQQGYSGFTTWTRGLAWAMVGFAEELEFLRSRGAEALEPFGGFDHWEPVLVEAARATCDWYIENTALDGIPYWDGGAPNLGKLGDWRSRDAEPFNDHEPVDASAAAIGAQGLLRLGNYLGSEAGERYTKAGLTVLARLLEEPYLSTDPTHQGLLLHSVYHQPNGWDHIPEGRKVPCGESSMWGDYHLRELALLVDRQIKGAPAYTFYGCLA